MIDRSDFSPPAQRLIERARALAPLLREHAGRDAQQRQVSAETMQALRAADLFRVLQPARWGGFEMAPGVFAEIQIALAAGDMSAAWVYGVVGVHPFQLALFDDRAAQDVWGSDNSVLDRFDLYADRPRHTNRWWFSFQWQMEIFQWLRFIAIGFCSAV